MTPGRREILRGLSCLALSSSAFGLAGACASGEPSTRGQAKPIATIAVLSPVSGANAVVGRAMERGARLAAGTDLKLHVLDTGSTVAGAAAAGLSAARLKAGLIIGPASGEEARAVGGSLPVLALSNDENLGGAFGLGLTAAQSVGAVLAYARGQGVRTLAMITTGSAWSAQCEAAARRIALSAGLQVMGGVTPAAGDASGALVAGLRRLGGGQAPNAVLVPEGGAFLAGVAAELAASGIQILGTSQWLGEDFLLPAVAGAWVAGPDPAASTSFAVAYQKQHAEQPGLIAALSYDATMIARALARAGELNRAGLVSPEGFGGLLGPIRFAEDGRAQRRLSILVAARGGARILAGGPREWA